MFRRVAATPGVATAVASRAFKTKASEQAAAAARKKAQDKANQGRDPYGLFKTAIMSEPNKDAKAARPHHLDWKAHRAAYSRAKKLEHDRVGAHLTKMIHARQAAVEALPPELQQEAEEPDYSLVPIERRVFTETAPISDFQEKLQRSAATDT